MGSNCVSARGSPPPLSPHHNLPGCLSPRFYMTLNNLEIVLLPPFEWNSQKPKFDKRPLLIKIFCGLFSLVASCLSCNSALFFSPRSFPFWIRRPSIGGGLEGFHGPLVFPLSASYYDTTRTMFWSFVENFPPRVSSK